LFFVFVVLPSSCVSFRECFLEDTAFFLSPLTFMEKGLLLLVIGRPLSRPSIPCTFFLLLESSGPVLTFLPTTDFAFLPVRVGSRRSFPTPVFSPCFFLLLSLPVFFCYVSFLLKKTPRVDQSFVHSLRAECFNRVPDLHVVFRFFPAVPFFLFTSVFLLMGHYPERFFYFCEDTLFFG